MGAQLSKINTQPALKPPRIVLHGKGGSGKTTFGASIPDAVLLPVEQGEGILRVPTLPQPESLSDVFGAIDELAREEHPYKALVIDTVDKVEPLVWAETCKGTKYDDIEGFGYGKGYIHADRHWIELFQRLDALRERGMIVCVLSHNETRTVNDPMTGPYDATTPKLHKRANALLYEWADIVGFLDVEKASVEKESATGKKMSTSVGLGGRVLYLEPIGGFEAKNRYALPSRLKVPKEGGYGVLRAELAKAIKAATAPTTNDTPNPKEAA